MVRLEGVCEHHIIATFSGVSKGFQGVLLVLALGLCSMFHGSVEDVLKTGVCCGQSGFAKCSDTEILLRRSCYWIPLQLTEESHVSTKYWKIWGAEGWLFSRRIHFERPLQATVTSVWQTLHPTIAAAGLTMSSSNSKEISESKLKKTTNLSNAELETFDNQRSQP